MKHQKEKKNIFGPAINDARKKSKPPVTQEELSARLATKGLVLDRSAISRIEKQERYLMDYELLAICEALRISLIEILNSTLRTKK